MRKIVNYFLVGLIILVTGCSQQKLFTPPNIIPDEDRPIERVNDSLFPKSEQPAENLLLLRFNDTRLERDFLTYVMQGLINREEPRVYVEDYFYERVDKQIDHWISYLQDKGYDFEQIEPVELLQRFEDKFSGIILYDEEIFLNPDLKNNMNVLITLAGVKNALPMTPELLEEMGTDLPIIFDARGRWADSISAYRWAVENLLSETNDQILAHLPPVSYLESIDYLVQFKIFTFFISNDMKDEEYEIFDEIMLSTPPLTPIIGVWAMDDRLSAPHGTMDEWAFVKWVSSFGKFMIVTHSSGNLSIHSGFTIDNLTQKELPMPELEEDKIYVTFILSDGDNAAGAMLLRPKLWNDLAHRKARKEIPLGWNWAPAFLDLAPTIFDYFYSTSESTELHVAASSGVGYISPSYFGSKFPEQKNELLEDYLSLSWEYMEKVDMRTVWLWWTDNNFVNVVAREIPELEGAFLEPFPFQCYSSSHRLSNDVPILWTFGNAATWSVDDMASLAQSAKQQLGDERPGFLFFGVNGFGFGPDSIYQLVQREFSDEVFEVVRPDHFAHLYKLSRTLEADSNKHN